MHEDVIALPARLQVGEWRSFLPPSLKRSRLLISPGANSQ